MKHAPVSRSVTLAALVTALLLVASLPGSPSIRAQQPPDAPLAVCPLSVHAMLDEMSLPSESALVALPAKAIESPGA